ncbi:TetR/AcrR family transcriptional regulator [Streptomyces sp. NPDC048282]|uniref:TetR/AcrR family transcriptional regulator n=1 Tax=unclassified Streptomyces TaxID=2593676 RepID=UPI00372222C7
MRADLLRAAREVFGERGYEGARTREIAERAQATEQTMYRHFRTKEELFEQSVFQPFSQLVAEFVEEFQQRTERGLSDEQLTRDYVTMLFRFLRANRRELLSLVTLYSHSPALVPQSPLDQLFLALEQTVVTGLTEHGQDPAGFRRYVRLTFGMVFSAAVLDERFLGLDADRDEGPLLDELTAYVLAGFLGQGAQGTRP